MQLFNIYFGRCNSKVFRDTGFPGGSMVKNSPADAGDAGDVGLIPSRKIAWSRKWQPASRFLPVKWAEEPCRQQSMRSQRVGHDLLTEQARLNLH